MNINWSKYNRELVNRGSVTLWIEQDSLTRWYNTTKTGKRGASNTYSEMTIKIMSLVRFRYRLTLRATEGFVRSILALMSTTLATPDYSTLSRRLAETQSFAAKMKSNQPVHVVIDSTGLKVFGEGEWKVRQHGYSKRRTWRKIHLAVDESNNQIVAVALTGNDKKDSELFPELSRQIKGDVYQFTGDGAYDAKNCYDSAEKRGALLVAPPRANAIINQHGNSGKIPLLRDEHLRFRRKYGKAYWKNVFCYGRRSISETAMYRLKTTLGDHLASRKSTNQTAEAILKCTILNVMKTPAAL